jgi:hypothetical protein
MKKEWKFFLVATAVVVVGGLVGFYALGKNAPDLTKNSQTGTGQVAGATTIDNGDYVARLAKSLTDKGVVLYGSYQSAELKQQKALFGGAAANLNYVECDATGPNANPDECVGRNIQVYPTWIYQEKQYQGIEALSDLAKMISFSE